MSLSVRVDCGDTVFKENFERWLAAEGLELCNDGKFHLLVDRPLGWAVLEHPDVDYTCCVTLSDNLCPSYQLDLLARNPAALIRLAAGDALLPALKSVSTGSVLHPAVATPLTAAERKTLRLVAFGYTNRQIAQKRGVTDRTVKNSLSAIYKKLNLHSRVRATHYYLGNWHLIVDWEKPPFLP